MLKLQPNPTFIAPVNIPTPEGPVTIRVRYKHMPVDQYNDFIKRGTPNIPASQKIAEAIVGLSAVRRLVPDSEELVSKLIETIGSAKLPAEDPADPPRKAITNEEAIMECVAGWEDVDGEFNREAVNSLCQQYHAAAGAIVDEFIIQLTQFKRKN